MSLTGPYGEKRFISSFDSTRMANIAADVLVIGTGVAGMRAAIAAADAGAQVIAVTKASVRESNTAYAQGGIAAAVGAGDDQQQHFEDTVRVGCGLCRENAVRTLVADGPARIAELIDWGMAFDRADTELALGREGGHSQRRIAHADGDRTGAALTETLLRRVSGCENVRIFEECFVIDFLSESGSCVGAVTFHPRYGHQLIRAKRTVLAAGGCGRLWRETTNPAVATGDGLSAAWRLGAPLASLEMMQFHPTTLYIAGAARALISEAVRGEGAHLVDRDGYRFMKDYDDAMELAPRDVVSRAIHAHLQETRQPCVYLDVRHVKGVAARFPHLADLCREFQIDIEHDLVPVRPSAHYMIGGVAADGEARSGVPGLFACGEAAYSGVHGANRLASNSLLEGLVFGRLAGDRAAAEALDDTVGTSRLVNDIPASSRTGLDIADIRHSLASVMWRNVGVERIADRLAETLNILGFWGHYTMDKTFEEPAEWEAQNMLTLAYLVVTSAMQRDHSIGVHRRGDEPDLPTADAGRNGAYIVGLRRGADGAINVTHQPV